MYIYVGNVALTKQLDCISRWQPLGANTNFNGCCYVFWTRPLRSQIIFGNRFNANLSLANSQSACEMIGSHNDGTMYGVSS